MKTLYQLLLIGLLLAVSLKANASTVGWQSTPFDTTPMLDSQGSLLDASYVFELGTFAGGFIPTSANTDLWASNWKLLSRSSFPDNWDPLAPSYQNIFSFNTNGTVVGLANSATFSTGELAYVWAYSGMEWALVTDMSGADRWALPSPADATGSDVPVFVLSSADTVVVGGVNGMHSGSPYTNDNGGAFQIQTAMVPEPSSFLFVLLAGCAMLGRRRFSH